MAKILSIDGRAQLARVVDPIGRALARAGITPNAVTITGTIGVVTASVGLVAFGRFLPALIAVTVCALTDMIDGAVARARPDTGRRFGAFLDSTADRIADGALFAALAFWFGRDDRPILAALTLFCLVGGQVISYARARAESLGLKGNVGIAERTERLLLLAAGGLVTVLGFDAGIEVALWILAGLTLITIIQRMWYVYRQDAARAAGQ